MNKETKKTFKTIAIMTTFRDVIPNNEFGESIIGNLNDSVSLYNYNGGISLKVKRTSTVDTKTLMKSIKKSVISLITKYYDDFEAEMSNEYMIDFDYDVIDDDFIDNMFVITTEGKFIYIDFDE